MTEDRDTGPDPWMKLRDEYLLDLGVKIEHAPSYKGFKRSPHPKYF